MDILMREEEHYVSVQLAKIAEHVPTQKQLTKLHVQLLSKVNMETKHIHTSTYIFIHAEAAHQAAYPALVQGQHARPHHPISMNGRRHLFHKHMHACIHTRLYAHAQA